MNSQFEPTPAECLAGGTARRLGATGGELTVVTGRVWLTRRGAPGDHVLRPGQRVRLGGSDDAVIEAWDATEGAQVRWRPHRGGVGALLAAPLRGVAVVARSLALACAAVARSASRAHGRLGGTPG